MDILDGPYPDVVKRLELREIVSNHVQGDSSPGFPYVKYGKRNKDIFSNARLTEIIFSAVIQRLRLILCTLETTPLTELEKWTPTALVRAGLVDPIKVFIKNEPHKRKKLDTDKLRLISNVSIVDQIIERILSSPQNNAEIRRWKECPSKPGMGLHDEGLEHLYNEVQEQSNHMRLAETDISGWDWSVQSWTLSMDGEARVRLAHAPPSSTFAVLTRFRSAVVLRKLFILSNGLLIEQILPGIQASGSYNTSSTNSRMRVMLGYLIGVSWVMAMGDDDVEEWQSGARDKYANYGYPVKDYKECPKGSFEFCSTKFDGSWKGIPSSWVRTVYRYLSHSPAAHVANPAYRVQLADDLRHIPNQQEILEKCDSVVEQESKRREQDASGGHTNTPPARSSRPSIFGFSG